MFKSYEYMYSYKNIYIYIYIHIYIYTECCRGWIDIPAISKKLDLNLVHVHFRSRVQELDKHSCIDLGFEHNVTADR